MIQWDEQTNARAENDLTRWNSFDALTTFGIKLWTPEIQAWREVSIKGRAYAPRRVNGTVGEKLHTDPTTTQLGLEITDGSLIDLCGAVLLFQKPTTMANQKQVSKNQSII